MFGFSKIQMIAAAVAVALLAVGALYYKGYSDGKDKVRIEQLKSDVEAFKTRQKVNNEVSNSSDYDLCIAVGGVRDSCSKLFGVGESPKAK